MIFTVKGLKVNVLKKNKIVYCTACRKRTENERMVYYADEVATPTGHALAYHRLCPACVPEFIKAEIEPDYAPPFAITY